MIRALTATAALLSSASTAVAGGYVAAIPSVAPPALSSGPSGGEWLIGAGLLAALAFLLGRSSSDGHITPLPPEHSGPCFLEGTLIVLSNGYTKPVERLQVGDLVWTSRGPQPVLHVASWRPTNYRDRPCIVRSIHLSPGHRVLLEGEVMTALDACNGKRGKIDGKSYYHVLINDHAWLKAAVVAGFPLRCESLQLTTDMPALAERFPHVLAAHEANPLIADEVMT